MGKRFVALHWHIIHSGVFKYLLSFCSEEGTKQEGAFPLSSGSCWPCWETGHYRGECSQPVDKHQGRDVEEAQASGESGVIWIRKR